MLASIALTSLVPAQGMAQVVPGPGSMVWQQGMNDAAEWKRLGCPRDYSNDDEKAAMVGRGECRYIRPEGSPVAVAPITTDKPTIRSQRGRSLRKPR